METQDPKPKAEPKPKATKESETVTAAKEAIKGLTPHETRQYFLTELRKIADFQHPDFIALSLLAKSKGVQIN